MHSTCRHLSASRRAEAGSALLTAMFCVMVVGAAATSMTLMVRQEMHVNRMLVNQAKALEIADGAAAQALGLFRSNKQNLVTPPAELRSGTMGEGSYEVELFSPASTQFAVVSTGTVAGVSETVKVFLDVPWATEARMKGVFANLDFRATGGGGVNGANLENGSHSNQNSDIGGNVIISGNASSVGSTTVSGAGEVNGTVESNVPRIRFPALDYDYYFRIAQANGQVYYGDKMLKGDYAPAGGVMWVVGNVRIASHTNFTGAIFATGDIDQAGSFNQYKVNDYPAVVSRFGDIHLSGSSDAMEGLIYAGSGNIDLTGSHRIKGALWAWGEVFTRGNWGVVDFAAQKPKLAGGDLVAIAAWER